MLIDKIQKLIFEINNKQQNNLVIIIKGNSKYINNVNIKPLADNFYDSIKHNIEAKGYIVKFRSSNDFVLHNKYAKIWIGHSRGCSTWDFRNKKINPTILRICLQTKSNEWDSPLHYQLSDDDLLKLNKIPNYVEIPYIASK